MQNLTRKHMHCKVLCPFFVTMVISTLQKVEKMKHLKQPALWDATGLELWSEAAQAPVEALPQRASAPHFPHLYAVAGASTHYMNCSRKEMQSVWTASTRPGSSWELWAWFKIHRSRTVNTVTGFGWTIELSWIYRYGQNSIELVVYYIFFSNHIFLWFGFYDTLPPHTHKYLKKK